MDMHILVITSY